MGSGTLVFSTSASPAWCMAPSRLSVTLLEGWVTFSACILLLKKNSQQYRVLVECQLHAKSFMHLPVYSAHHSHKRLFFMRRGYEQTLEHVWQHTVMLENTRFGARQSGFASQMHCFLAMWPRVSHLTTPCFSFFRCKKALIITSAL